MKESIKQIVDGIIDAHLLKVERLKNGLSNNTEVYDNIIRQNLDKLSEGGEDMILFFNSRNEARAYTKKYNKGPLIDKGVDSPRGLRWAVRLY